MYCNENSTEGQHCFDNKFMTACRCIHRIKLDLNSIVELVLVNVDDQIAHPIHLHGHKFHIIDMGVFENKPIPGAVRKGLIPNVTHKNPPFKDTVVLPYPGYVRLRFRANNPGFWLFHCHFGKLYCLVFRLNSSYILSSSDWHLTTGMAVIFQVGEISDISKIKIPAKFPRCNDFTVDEIQ